MKKNLESIEAILFYPDPNKIYGTGSEGNLIQGGCGEFIATASYDDTSKTCTSDKQSVPDQCLAAK